jgi:hypothetical protein
MADMRIVEAIGAEWDHGHEPVDAPLAAALADFFQATAPAQRREGETVQQMARRCAEAGSVARYRVKMLLSDRGVDVD